MDKVDVRLYIYIYIYIYMHVYIHIVEYYSAIKQNEILPFATTWIDLECIMFIEISQTKTSTLCYPLYV